MFDSMNLDNARPIIQVFGFGKNGQSLCSRIEKRGVSGVEFIKNDEQYASSNDDKPLPSVVLTFEYDPKGYKQAVLDPDFNIYLVDENDLSEEIANIQRYTSKECLNCLVIINHDVKNIKISKKVNNFIKTMDFYLLFPFLITDKSNVCFEINPDDLIYRFIKSLSEVIYGPGLVCLDFTDIRYMLSKMGKTIVSTYLSADNNQVTKAIEALISSPDFNKNSLLNSKNILIILKSGMDLQLSDIDKAELYIKNIVSDAENIMVTTYINKDITDELRVTMIYG